MTSGQITYDLRRLRLQGLIERIPHTFRYRVTPTGLRTADGAYQGSHRRAHQRRRAHRL